MRTISLPTALAACIVWTPIPPTPPAQTALLQGNIALSAAAKRKPRSTAPNVVYQPALRRGGPADPSFGPDGKPYQVPEYLRNQCYIDEGYGRFSACSSFR